MDQDVTKQLECKAGERVATENLGKFYQSIGKYEQAVEYYKIDLNIAKQVGDKTAEEKAYFNLGICYTKTGKFDEALEHHQRRLEIAKQLGNIEGERTANGYLGHCYQSIEKYDKALEHYAMFLDFSKQRGIKAKQAKAYNEIGRCYEAIGKYDKALEHHKMHLDIAKQMEDKARERMAHCNLGICYRAIGKYNKALEHHKMDLDISKQLGDKAAEGGAYGNLGNCYQSIAKYGEALKHHKMQLDIARQLGDKVREGGAYGNIGICYQSIAQYDKALEHHKMHLEIAKNLGDRAGEGRANGSLGICYTCIGKYEKALEHHKIDLDIAKQLGDKAGEGGAYANLGICYRYIGKYDKALEHQEMHLEIAKQLGKKAEEGGAHGNLGNWYESIGKYDKALEHLKMCLDIAKQLGNKAGEGGAHANLGVCYQAIGKNERDLNIAKKVRNKALEHHKMHLDISKQLGDKSGEGKAYGNLGNCYQSIGRYEKACEYYKMRLDKAKQLGEESGEGTANGNLGNCYLSVRQYDKALEHQKLGLNIAKKLGDKANEGAAHCNLATTYLSLEQKEKSEYHCKKSLECLEELFHNVPEEDQFKVSIREMFVSTHTLLMRSLLDQDKIEEALVFAERGRARALTSLLFNKHPNRPAEVTKPAFLELCEIRKLVKALNCTVLFFAFVKLQMGIWVIQPNGDVTFKETAMVSSQANESTLANPFVSYCEQIVSLIRNAREMLKSGRAFKCEDRSLSFLYQDEATGRNQKKSDPGLVHSTTFPDVSDPEPLMSRGVHLSNSPLQSGEVSLTAIVGRLCEAEKKLLEQLYQTILGPVRQFVEGPRVLIVPDGPLPLFPFCALVDGDGQYVAESLEISLTPSLTIAKMITEYPEELKGQTTSPLIVGEPDVPSFEDGNQIFEVSKLPCAKKEAQMIGRLLHVEPLIAKAATKETVLQRIHSANLIHIAAHADMKRGEILLAPSPSIPVENIRKEDVMLTISDLEEKRLKAKLIVLSCCHTGQGEIKAEGVIGIARAFLGAGACAVLVSLWALDDNAALYFMEEFYKHLVTGERVNEALNNTMKAMRDHENYWHPYYWAPFVLIGADVTPFRK